MNSFFNVLFEDSKVKDSAVSGLTNELNTLYIYNTFINKNRSILVVINTIYEAVNVYESLLNYTDKVLFFPMDNFITSEAISISPEFKSERINTINKLIANDNYIVVTNLMGYLRYLPTKEIWNNSIININVGDEINKDKLLENLYHLGYTSEELVVETGSFSSRGYVIDIFPIGEDTPIRIELWGDTVDSIKYFDIETQGSTKNVNNITIYPFTEFLLECYDDDIVNSQKYLKYYSKNISKISDYLNNPICFYCDYNTLRVAYNTLQEDIFEYKKNNPNIIDIDYMNKLEEIYIKDEIYIMGIDDELIDKKVNITDKYLSSNIDNYNGDINRLKLDIEKAIRSGKTVILCISNNITAKNIVKYMELDNLILTKEDNIINNKVNLINKKIGNGFIFNNYIVISDNDIFNNVSKPHVYKSKYKMGSKISDVKNIEKGDYIVHEIFGIGIYDSIVTLTKNGLKMDYIKLLYAGGDVLYIPASKIDRISKYASREGYAPKINKLGTDEWQRKKAKLRDKINDIAGKIIKLSAEREAVKGFAFSSDSEEQVMFESEFEFIETTDQLIASTKIKESMEKARPMDMLLCGDVGYGKTEVAFRAIFKAVNDGKQVAYLCPTTILSDQQYKSALKRFENYPVNIRLLNRFVSSGEQKNTLEELKEGKADIVFGTHRLLSNDVDFKDLGLLIVDEEQRFGVIHKERIKEYKSNIDILTLSATPIPRTMQMSMAGIRELSLIETPPVDRYPVQTYVLPFNELVIKDAVYKELSRNGQVFILYNRVSDIESKVTQINKLVPEARVDFAHGQMSKISLENKMIDFINHEVDVLVCTTIIESGIDIPNVNTLVVIDADHYGLSQLYQIRGRVGRSNKVGYAYLMYDNRKILNDIAVKRLSTIKEFTELGSGFKIAMRDLSIRGAGDILGQEQSGFIDAVGIELYLKMLNDEIGKIKNNEVVKEEVVEEENDSKPLIELATHITDDYTLTDTLKIEIHKKINEIDSYDKLMEVKAELEDRFGKIDNDMLLYMHGEWFEKLAKLFDINEVKETKTYVEIILNKEVSSKIDGEKLFYGAYEISEYFKFVYKDNKIYITLSTMRLEKHYLYYLISLLEMMKSWL